MQKLLSALVKAQKAFQPIAKDRINPHYKSKYATLDSVLSATSSALWANELAIVQTFDVAEDKTFLVTTLYHSSGESISSRYPLPQLNDPQKFGAAVTYARRYSLCALLNVTADEDTDGNGSQSSPPRQIQPKSKAHPPELMKRLKNAREKAGATTQQVLEALDVKSINEASVQAIEGLIRIYEEQSIPA